MKKSLLLLGLSLASVLALSGCGASAASNEEAIINKLSHQLDRVTNTVSSSTMLPNSSTSISTISKKLSQANKSSFTKLSNAYQKISDVATNVEDNRELVLRKVKNLKREIAGGIKLGNQNAKAVSELTSSMQRYVTSLSRTKSDYKNTVQGIVKLDKTQGNEIDAKITRLNSCLQARDCYMKNILSSLENIQNIIDSTNQNDDVVEDENTEKPENIESGEKEFAPISNSPAQTPQNQPDENLFVPQTENSNQTANPYAYGNYNGAGGYGFGGGGTYRPGPFNPNRNTDTYGPGVTNIDTYRGYGFGRRGGGSNGINNLSSDKPATIPLEKGEQEIVTNNQNDEVLSPSADENLSEHNDEKKDESTKSVKKIVNGTSSENDKQVMPSNVKDEAKTLQEHFESCFTSDDQAKIKSVSGEKVEPSDKTKGHTNLCAMDINKKIEKLVKG